jgi:DNA-binding beta-propeller fold protein YncE
MNHKSCRTFLSALCPILALVTFAVAPRANAQLWGLTSSTPGSVYSINPATGAATFVTDLTGAVATSLVGLDILAGKLYATDVVAGAGFSFGTIDIATGAFTIINDQDGSANWHGLAASAAQNLLYTIDLNDSSKLKSVTPSGVVTAIGAGTGIFGVGMAFDDNHSLLYAVDGSSLYTVDTTTGTATLVGALGIGDGRFGLAYDPTTDTLYGNGGDTETLYTIDVTTGAATAVGPNGPTAGDHIDGLAFGSLTPAAVPEPGAFTSALAVGVGFLFLSRRRKA